MLDRITPLILTLNEAPNIARTLARLHWAREVVVVDSFSADETCEIVRRFPNARLVHRTFTTHAEQWNFGLQQAGISSEWVLALDADFIIPDRLAREVQSLQPPADVAGYQVNFIYCVEGEPLRGGIYPPVVLLFRREGAFYVQDGHTQRVTVAGRIAPMNAEALHDDRKPLASWLASQSRYMRLEAEKLRNTAVSDLGFADKIRRLVVFAPLGVFLYCMFVRGNVLDGKRGLFYAVQRATAEAILSLYLLFDLIKRPSVPPPDSPRGTKT